MHAHAIDQIKEHKSHQGEDKNCQVWADVPQVGDDHAAKITNCLELGHEALIGQTKYDSSYEEAEEAGDDVVQLAFTGASNGCTRAETCPSHADPEDEAANQISHDISFRDSREGDQTHRPQGIYAEHGDH